MKRYDLKIIPITGVYIGTGESISPIEYKLVRLKNGGTGLVCFSNDKIIKELPSQKREMFFCLLEKEDWAELIQFFHHNVTRNSMNYLIKYVDEEFKNIYPRKLGRLENQLLIGTMYRNSNFKPVIPGSSVKGSIRTAVLNMLLKDRNIPVPHGSREINNFEKRLLNNTNAHDDPFRGLIIRDSALEKNKDGSAIVKLSIFRKNSNEPQGQQIFAEIIRGKLMDNSVCFIGEMLIDDELLKIIYSEREKQGKKEYVSVSGIDKDLIVSSSNNFYSEIFNEEYEKFYEYSNLDKINILKDEIENIKSKDNVFLLRLGRFSQIESITFPGNFRQPVNAKRGYGNSRTLAVYKNEYYPLGWVKVEIEEKNA